MFNKNSQLANLIIQRSNYFYRHSCAGRNPEKPAIIARIDWISAFAEMTDAVNKGCSADSHRKCNEFVDAYLPAHEGQKKWPDR